MAKFDFKARGPDAVSGILKVNRGLNGLGQRRLLITVMGQRACA